LTADTLKNAARIGMNTTTLPAIVNAFFCTIIIGYAIWVTVAWPREQAAIQ